MGRSFSGSSRWVCWAFFLSVTGAMLVERWKLYDNEIRALATAYQVPPNLVKAVIMVESAWNPNAIRGEAHLADASRGLMQVLYSTAKSLGYVGSPEGLFDPAQNINIGTRLLRRLHDQLGNWTDAISAYNGGIRPSLGFGARATAPVTVCLARDARGDCARWRDVPVGEYGNQEYVDKVMAAWGRLNEGKAPSPRSGSRGPAS